jgi:hypothetical protein
MKTLFRIVWWGVRIALALVVMMLVLTQLIAFRGMD